MDDAPEQIALREAVKAAGSTYKLAALLSRHEPITQSAVAQWRRVPRKWVLRVEAATGVPRHRLAPDMYPASEAA